MKRFLFILIAVFTFWGTALAEKLVLDKVHSRISFVVTHLVITDIEGQFNEFDGEVDFDFAAQKLNSATAVVQVSSINTANDRRDGHLKSADFFDASKYPEIKFVSKKVEQQGTDISVIGDLTIKNTTKEVVLKGTLKGVIEDSELGKRAGFKAETVIDRFDYGLQWNKVIESGGLVVSASVKIILDVQIGK